MEIKVSDLTVSHASSIFLSKISFTLTQGQTLVIMGEYGCGKSQLLRHLIGLDPPTAGHIYYDNIDFWQVNRRERQECMHQFGVHYQHGGLWDNLTVSENVALPLRIHTKLKRKDIAVLVETKLTLLGISEHKDRYPDELNVNLRNLVAIARAIALDPRILILDEPFSGLDPLSAHNLGQLLQTLRINFKATIIMVSNDLTNTKLLADKVMILDRDTQQAVAYGDLPTVRNKIRNTKMQSFLDSLKGR